MSREQTPTEVRAAIFDLLYAIRPAVWGVQDEDGGYSMLDEDRRIGSAVTGWLAGCRPNGNGAETLIYDALTRLLFTLSSEEIRASRGLPGPEETAWLVRHDRADLVALRQRARTRAET